VIIIKEAGKQIRLLVVDDHTLFRSGLKMLLEKEDDINIVDDVASAEEALEALKKNDLDLILMDIGLPGMDGLEATRKIKEREPGIRILVLTMYNDDPYLIKAFEAGASGYLLKESAAAELVSAIRRTMEGEMIVHPSLVKVLVNEVLGDKKEDRGAQQSGAVLTQREKEILKYISLGYTNQELAERLVVSVKTIEKHKSNIMEKLNLNRRYQLVNYALEQGLINFDQ